MYTDYTVADVLDAMDCFVQDINNIWQGFNTRFDDLKNIYLESLDMCVEEPDTLSTIETDIDCEQKKITEFTENLKENQVDTENLEITVKNLKAIKLKKEAKRLELERTVNDLQEKVQTNSEKRKEIDRKRDEVLAYKILSGVDFVYSTKNVMGVINKEKPESFKFDTQKLKQEEIADKLWDLILKK